MYRRYSMFSRKSSILAITCLIILAIGLPLAGCTDGTTVGDSLKGTITEAGSTTVQPIAEQLADAFHQKYPGVTVTIQGGGTGVGIKSANEGTVDIGAASRELTEEDPALVKHVLCHDVIAIIVHSSNKVANITKQQIIDIFSGKTKNWSQLGGDNKDIHIVSREEGSGTRTAFTDMVMGKELILKTAILQSSNGAIKTTIANDAQAIGYLSLGYVDKSVKALSVEAIACTEENAKNGKYPIVRPLYFLTKAQPAGLVRQFIDFCQSDEGQKIVVSEGYVSVK
jgi:phosphate transport system substrate-binding protein